MYQIWAHEENSERKIRVEFSLDFFLERGYQDEVSYLAKMLLAPNPNRMRQERRLLPLLVLIVAIYGLVLAPLGRGG
jgi:hypothetical protein